ncbi:serine/threonine-protein kinase [Nocardia jejuensis]|uniref:serine/threonine-protein kinase n=1 Tax=Nocardia jejuensis TaxID=328049 RepID=UPI00082AA340|nr:serine/threonine-protein kinase [Nocardia jejuensis]
MPGDGELGHYRLVKLLGRGGMGQVWLAEDSILEREVALKLLPSELASDQDYRRRFEREARLAARLRGPHVVPIHSFGELDGRLFIDMELVDGSDLGKILDRTGALTPARAVDLLGQIAEALDVAHKAGLIHRDVKPSNVLTLPSGYAYLIDFGIARGIGQSSLTSTGIAVGTYAYMAPERFAGVEDDLRSDVYSLACLLFECLTGKRPFAQTNPAQQMAAHLTAPPPRASDHSRLVPAALDAVIARGMAKDPGRRYNSAGELASDAATALRGGGSAAYTPPPIDRAAPPSGRDGTPVRAYGSGPVSQPAIPMTPPPVGMHSAATSTRPAAPGYSGGPSHSGPVSGHGGPVSRNSGPIARNGGQSPYGGGPVPAPYGSSPIPAPRGSSPIPAPRGSGPIPRNGAPAPGGSGSIDMSFAGYRKPEVAPRIQPWRPLVWILLALGLLLFGMTTAVAVTETFNARHNSASDIIATVAAAFLFTSPFVVCVYYTVREVKRFKAVRR